MNGNVLIIILLVANILFPLIGGKLFLLDPTNEERKLKKVLQDTRQNASSLSFFEQNPNAFHQFIQQMAERKKELDQFLPKEMSMIEMQKLLANKAKRHDLSIISLDPDKKELPFYQEKAEIPKIDSKGEEIKPVPVEGVLKGVIEITLKGDYEGFVSFFNEIESFDQAILFFDEFIMQKSTIGPDDKIEAILSVGMLYKSPKEF